MRMRRLLALWNWLPAFRAVAETQHLTRAAAKLGVSPSSVSRTLGLLEEQVGQPLFDRTGRHIALNAAGTELLAGLRKAMRLVEESLSIVQGTRHVGPVHVATVQPLTSAFVLPALSRLQTNYPRMVPHLSRLRLHELNTALLTGSVDIALTQQARPHRQLRIELLGAIPHSVYVGRGHPLHRVRSPSLERVLSHAFVAVHSDQRTASVEPWPLELQRNVTLYVDDVELAVAACTSGKYVAVLPDVAAGAQSGHGRLWRIAVPVIPACNVYGVRREQLTPGERAQAVLKAIRDEVAERIGIGLRG